MHTNQYQNSQNHVEHIRPPHGFRHHKGSVFNFFGCEMLAVILLDQAARYSHMWTMLSEPRLQYMTVTWGTRQAVPMLDQPPLFTKDVNTSSAEFRGQRTHRATKVISHPAICPNSDAVSIAGSVPAPTVLKPMVTTTNANMSRVYCQLLKAKSGLITSAQTSMRVVTTKTLEAMLASQPNVDIHPIKKEVSGGTSGCRGQRTG